MRAIQLWLPRFGRSIRHPTVARDAARAFESWKHELVVWMLPEINRPVRWQMAGVGHLAMPSEEFDRVDVVHVTAEGSTYAPTLDGVVPPSVARLLESWLNLTGPEWLEAEAANKIDQALRRAAARTVEG